MSRRSAAVAAAAVLLTVVPPSVAAPTHGSDRPTDYTRIPGLTRAHLATRRDATWVRMSDGVRLYVEVERPRTRGRYGTILEVSPYHGGLPPGMPADRTGARILPDATDDKGHHVGLTGYFAPRGYAVVMVDVRGTGRSEGCLDYLGRRDQRDFYDVIEWAARQPWSNGRVGLVGHSYPGSTPIFAAAQRPPHLRTIVVSAGLGAMYHHEFQAGVPYNAQYVGAAGVYDAYTFDEGSLTDAPDSPTDAGCGLPNSAASTGPAYVTGATTRWHAERDVRAKATAAPIPVFAIHGVDDASVRTAALDWFTARRRPGDKLWLGQWGHDPGGSCHCVGGRHEQWTEALHAWFDHHLLGRKVSTGRPVEVFLNSGEAVTAPRWPIPARSWRLYATTGGRLRPRPAPEQETASYVADAGGFEDDFATGHLTFDSDRVTRDTLLLGTPTMRLTAAITAPRLHLLATLYDVGPDGRVDRISEAGFAIQPELRHGVDHPTAVTPGELMPMRLTGLVQAHLLARGHRLRLVIASSHPDKIPTLASGALVQVALGGRIGTELSLPVVVGAARYPAPADE